MVHFSRGFRNDTTMKVTIAWTALVIAVDHVHGDFLPPFVPTDLACSMGKVLLNEGKIEFVCPCSAPK
jgi:hypothetical protein